METTTKEIAYWNDQFERCQKLREQLERQWYMNLAFYFGKQYVSWFPQSSPNLSTQRLVEPPAPRYRVRLVSNKIMPAVRTELTKLTKEEPQFYCTPNSYEPTDVMAARVGEAVTEFTIDNSFFNKARRSATWWMLLCGTSFIKETVTDKEGGSTVFDPITAFHLFVPNLQEELLENQPFVIHARGLDPQVVEDMYGVKLAPTSAAGPGALDNKLFNALGLRENAANPGKDLVYLKEIYVKPCKKYPDGAFLVMCENQMIHAHTDAQDPLEGDPQIDNTMTQGQPFNQIGKVTSPNGNTPIGASMDSTQITVAPEYTVSKYPYQHGMFPFVKLDHIPSGTFYAQSSVKDLIPLQREYNKTRSQIIEGKNRTSKPQMVYVKGSIEPNKVTSEPGLMIPVNPGFAMPNYLTLEDIPGYVIQELDRTLQDMDDITGQYEVSKGRTPPGVEAASAIAYLQEENDSKMYHTVASIEEATEVLAKQLLCNVQQYYTPDRILSIVSKNSQQDAMVFAQADLKNNTDIRVESGSMAPKSRAARQAFITDLMKNGIIDTQKGLRYLQLNETNRLYEELQADARQAERENFRMANGETNIPINEWDDDQAHINSHGLYFKSQEFEMLDQNLQDGAVVHYMAHKQRLLPTQLGALSGTGNQSAGIPTGASPGPGNPDQPIS